MIVYLMTCKKLNEYYDCKMKLQKEKPQHQNKRLFLAVYTF